MRFILVAALGLMLAACGGGDAPAASPTADDVVAALKSTGLPIGDTLAYTAETDPNDLLGRPGGYASKTAFHDTRIDNPTGEFDVDYGGDVEVFDEVEAAEARAEYIEGIVKALPIVTQYVYQQGPVVLRVSAALTPEQAAEYEAALSEIE